MLQIHAYRRRPWDGRKDQQSKSQSCGRDKSNVERKLSRASAVAFERARLKLRRTFRYPTNNIYQLYMRSQFFKKFHNFGQVQPRVGRHVFLCDIDDTTKL